MFLCAHGPALHRLHMRMLQSGCGWTPAGFHGLSFKDQLCECCSGYVGVFFLAFFFFSVIFFERAWIKVYFFHISWFKGQCPTLRLKHSLFCVPGERKTSFFSLLPKTPPHLGVFPSLTSKEGHLAVRMQPSHQPNISMRPPAALENSHSTWCCSVIPKSGLKKGVVGGVGVGLHPSSHKFMAG